MIKKSGKTSPQFKRSSGLIMVSTFMLGTSMAGITYASQEDLFQTSGSPGGNDPSVDFNSNATLRNDFANLAPLDEEVPTTDSTNNTHWSLTSWLLGTRR